MHHGMHIAAIHTYPVKGCYRVDVASAAVEPWGLADDRRWLIVDPETGGAITQRELPGLTKIRPAVAPDGLVLRAAGRAELAVPFPRPADLLEVSVWSFTGPAARAGAEADDWLSVVLDRKVRLVWQHDPTGRSVREDYAEPGDTVSFADGFPVLLANTASLADLNDRIAESGSLEGPLPMTRFRPNLVIAGAPAWAEDAWTGHRVRVGEVTFRVPKPCDRCVVTTTDQETGERGREPLRTLARFRNINQGLMFATNMTPDNRGTIHVGDPVIAL